MICLIPARGGSRRLPRKNLLELGGKPLVAHTIEAALQTQLFDDVDVSTENDEIARIASTYHARIPYRRPERLATDNSTNMEVLLYHLEAIGPVDPDETIVLLQATCPFRRAEDIKDAVRHFNNSDADTLVSITDYPHPPQWALREDKNHFVINAWPGQSIGRSQETDRVFCPSGATAIGRAAILRERRSFYGPRCIGFYMDRHKSLDIDDELDLRIAQALMNQEDSTQQSVIT